MRYVALVRYGTMDNIEFFEVSEPGVHEQDELIVRTERGIEWGEMVSQLQRWEDSSRSDRKTTGEVLRKSTDDDRQKQQQIAACEKEELQFCKGLIEKYKLPMKLVNVEHLFGGNKIIFFFLADGRVDFRQLVKELAEKYRMRIEMRQIGARDEAKMMGRFGSCGRELCCRTFLKALKPVAMKMAKTQKSTLDPAKISGCCGKLKCCLRFEHGLYEELKHQLPRRGARVKTPEGEGVVVEHHILRQTVEVKLSEGVKKAFAARELEVIDGQKSGQKLGAPD